MSNTLHNLELVRRSVMAVGVKLDSQRVSILGSGFSAGERDKIVSAAHIYNQLPTEQIASLAAMVMTQRDEAGIEHYTWLPISLIDKDDGNDLAIFQLAGDVSTTLLNPLELGDSDLVIVGQDAYFVGFPYAAQLINDGFGITLVVNRTIISNIKQDGIHPVHPRNFIMVDAISNPGNSGCPLVDADTGKVIGVMTIAFRTASKIHPGLDIREPMHIAGARPINLIRNLLKKTGQ